MTYNIFFFAFTTRHQAIFSFRSVNKILAGKAKREKSLIQILFEMSTAHVLMQDDLRRRKKFRLITSSAKVHVIKIGKCQRAASRRRKAVRWQPSKAARGNFKAEWISNRCNIKQCKVLFVTECRTMNFFNYFNEFLFVMYYIFLHTDL